MIHRHSKEWIERHYSQAEGLNQSSIKEILKSGMESFLVQAEYLLKTEDKLYYEEKEHYTIGNAVDDHVSQGEEYYNNNYYFSTLIDKPKATAASVIHMVFDMVKSKISNGETIDNLLSYKEQIYHAIEEHQYYKDRRKNTWEEDTRYTQLLNVKTGSKKEEQYWQDLIVAGTRKVLSDYQNITTKKIINSFHYHPFTSKFFMDRPDVDIVYQFPIFWVYEGVKCKGLIDHIFIDHTTKQIFKLDEKTFGDYISRFNVSMKKLRYDIQGSYYSFGFHQGDNIKVLEEKIGKKLDGYKYINFAFVAESTKKPGLPLIFPLTDSVLRQGQFGDRDKLQGWHQGIMIYKEWSDSNFNIEEIYKKSEGVVFIDETFNYQNKLE